MPHPGLPQRGRAAFPGRWLIDHPAIDIRDVHKRFTIPRRLGQILAHPFARKRIEVLNGVNLAVGHGSVTGILGPNGAGKTTLLRVLAATITPDRGQVTILERDAIGSPAAVRRRLGFVLSEERSFFWRLTARHNLSFFATLADLEPGHIRPRIDELSRMIGIRQELDKPFRDLSTGMRQRLSLARALLHDPEVLLIDEPTRALDPGAARRTRELIRRTFADQMKKTILLATHDVAEARELCDRVAFLKDGQIEIEDETDAALQHVGRIFGEDA